MDADEFRSIIEEEALLLDRFGMVELAAKMRACTTLGEAVELHQEIDALLRVVRMARHE